MNCDVFSQAPSTGKLLGRENDEFKLRGCNDVITKMASNVKLALHSVNLQVAKQSFLHTPLSVAQCIEMGKFKWPIVPF